MDLIQGLKLVNRVLDAFSKILESALLLFSMQLEISSVFDPRLKHRRDDN